MSNRLPNYCAPHGTHYGAHCPRCVQEWMASLSREEQALVNYHAKWWTPTMAKRGVEALRAMTLEPTASEQRV